MSGSRAVESFQGDRFVVGKSNSAVAPSEAKRLAGSAKLLFLIFLLSLPLVNPWVRGDGVGYYAYVRSLLIDHDLRFENDYLGGNESFVLARVDAQGHILPSLYTKTGYVGNHFSVGPAILWAPALVPVHAAVRLANQLGARIPADGYSRPYLIAMALTTACYGFLALLLAFRIGVKYFEPRWTFFAVVGIWFASSLPVYMYFNPSWSHALSAFTVGLFLWYWDRTCSSRTLRQWALLGLMAGLMANVYYPNVILLIFPAVEVAHLLRESGDAFGARARELGLRCALFAAVLLAALTPTFLTRQIIYGSSFESGYPGIATWHWTSPVFASVLFSSDHGMFSWTPILLLAVVGLPFLIKRSPLLGTGAALTFLAFYYFIASYPDWDGLSSYGNRFFVSLTPIFVLGLAALLDAFSKWLRNAARAAQLASPVLLLLILWNFGFIFQWGTHMVPVRGEISWSAMVHNQFVEVPARVTHGLETYFLHRSEMMQHIEQEDIEQQKLDGTHGEGTHGEGTQGQGK
jgi:hypothetical protein